MRIPTLFLALCLAAPAAQADIFDLSDDTLDVVPVPAAPAPETPPAPTPSPVSARVPAAPPPATPLPTTPVRPPEMPPLPVKAPAVPTTPIPATSPAKPSPFAPQFPLYRAARQAQLAGDAKGAFIAFSRLLRAAEKSKSDTLQSSPFACAARFHREECRLTGDAGDKAKAMVNLRKFREAKDAAAGLGPYLGDALLLLARERMDANHPLDAAPYIEQLGRWVKERRAEKEGEDLLGDLRPAVTPAPSPWSAEKDCLGHFRRAPVSPAWLLNPAVCPWRLDEVESQWAKSAGLVALMQGDTPTMKARWGRVGELSANLRPKTDSTKIKAPPRAAPTEADRLAFVAKTGRILAWPGEEHLLDSWPGAKERVMYAEYLYITDDFGKAKLELKEVLDADDKVKGQAMAQAKAMEEARKKNHGGVMLVQKVRMPGMTDAARDYAQTALGLVLCRLGDEAGAVQCFEAVFKKTSGHSVERRTVLAYLNTARKCGTAQQVQQAEKLWAALAASPIHDRASCTARFWRALELEDAGRKQEAERTLAWFAPGDGKFYDFARKRVEAGKRKR